MIVHSGYSCLIIVRQSKKKKKKKKTEILGKKLIWRDKFFSYLHWFKYEHKLKIITESCCFGRVIRPSDTGVSVVSLQMASDGTLRLSGPVFSHKALWKSFIVHWPHHEKTQCGNLGSTFCSHQNSNKRATPATSGHQDTRVNFS